MVARMGVRCQVAGAQAGWAGVACGQGAMSFLHDRFACAELGNDRDEAALGGGELCRSRAA